MQRVRCEAVVFLLFSVAATFFICILYLKPSLVAGKPNPFWVNGGSSFQPHNDDRGCCSLSLHTLLNSTSCSPPPTTTTPTTTAATTIQQQKSCILIIKAIQLHWVVAFMPLLLVNYRHPLRGIRPRPNTKWIRPIVLNVYQSMMLPRPPLWDIVPRANSVHCAWLWRL